MQIDYAAMREMYDQTGYQLAYYSPIGLLYCMVKSSDRLKLSFIDHNILIEGDDGIEFIYLRAGGNNERIRSHAQGKSLSYIDPSSRHLFGDLKPSDQKHHEVVYDIRRFTDFSEIPGKARLSRRFAESYHGVQFRHGNTVDAGFLLTIQKLYTKWQWKTSHSSSHELESIERICRMRNFPHIEVYSLHDRGDLIAYCIGDRGNGGMFMLHFIKCDTRYRGIYQYFHHKIGHHQRNTYGSHSINYTNLTDNAGLREMKLQLKPSRFLIPYCSPQCYCC